MLQGSDANLTQNEYKLVALLGLHAGKVLTYDYLIKELWGPSARSDNQILRVNMANIRRKIEQNPAQPVVYLYRGRHRLSHDRGRILGFSWSKRQLS